MIINFNQPYSLNFGEDFNYISTFVNSELVKSNTAPTIKDYRILVEGVKTKNLVLLFVNEMNFFGKNRYRIEFIEGFKLTPNHIRNKGRDKTYFYNDIGYNPSNVEDMLDAWKKSDPMVHVGSKTHQFISRANGYTWSYKFNNKTY